MADFPIANDQRTIESLKELGVSVCDSSGNLKGIKQILDEVMKVTARANEPLLTIELQNETAVPKVFYEGKEITDKVNVSFDWETKTAELGSGGTKYNIEYADAKDGEPIIKGLGLARGKYALNSNESINLCNECDTPKSLGIVTRGME